MTTLTVSSTANFSAQALSNIDKIDFTNFIAATTATFSAGQFDDTQIFIDVLIDGSAASNAVVVNVANALDASGWSFTGWSFNDAVTFNGSSAANVFRGSVQKETVNGGNGDDIIFGSAGADVLNGGANIDSVDYSATVSPTTLNIDLAANTATGGDAAGDTYSGIENLIGGGGGDIFNGSDVANILTGNGGADTLRGQGGGDTLIGGAGADKLDGGSGDDLIVINAGDLATGETIDGGVGIGDRLTGGGTFDQFGTIANVEIFEFANLGVRFSGNQIGGLTALQTVVGSAGADLLAIVGGAAVNLSTVTFQNWSANDHVQISNGTPGDDVWVASDFADEIILSAGADQIQGRDGDDVFKAGSATDVAPGLLVFGGEGSDEIRVFNSGTYDFSRAGLSGVERIDMVGGTAALVFDSAQVGVGRLVFIDGFGLPSDTLLIKGGSVSMNDLVFTTWNASAAIVLEGSENGDTLTGGTAGRVTLRGLGGNDTLTASQNDDRLDGGAGGDNMIGGLGNDTYINPVISGATPDAIVEAANGGAADVVQSNASFSLVNVANVERLVLTGTAAIDGTGNVLSNILVGNGAANTLIGRNGDDVLGGGGGNDILLGGSGNDKLDGGDGADIFRFTTVNAEFDRIDNFETAVDRFDLSGGSFTAAVVSNGNTTLTHNGGKIILAGITGLDLGQWNDLVVSGGRDAPAFDATHHMPAIGHFGTADFLYA